MSKQSQSHELSIRGINYDTGTNYANGLSRPIWHGPSVQRDMKVIAAELHCNAIAIFGTDIDRVAEAAKYAANEGLQIWLQPRLIEGTQKEVLQHLAEFAKLAESLRVKGADVTLNVGCEHSLFMQGIFPGITYGKRIPFMIIAPIIPGFRHRLNTHLKKVSDVARTHFNGPITYSSGAWEKIDWTLFDYVGVDYYRDRQNQKHYEEGLQRLHKYGKPVIITEFGCCPFKGADKSSGAGFLAINWKSTPPTVKPNIVRDEETQARYLTEMVSIYKRNNVTGAFAFAFSEPSNPYSEKPEHDLDVASFGVVKITSNPDTYTNKLEAWEPKRGFSALAESYSNITQR
jgi:hypothetical protein